MKALVTGSAGYVGSHVVAALGRAGHDAVGLDDLSRGNREAHVRAERLAGRSVPLEVGDLCDRAFVDEVLRRHAPDVVLHVAAYKSVEESVRHPHRYERNNVHATRTLAESLDAHGPRVLVYASTGAVYGEPDSPQIAETDPVSPINPYGETKLRAEQDLARRDLALAALRFFNVCGAHPSGDLGEFGKASPNLFPVVLRRLADPAPRVSVFGTDWPTRDGTCVRDYVHVVDVAEACVAAAGYLLEHGGRHVWNVGTGRGSTVLEVVAAIERAAGVAIERVPAPRRPGDPAAVVASVDLARAELGFEARYDLDDMARTALRWAAREGT